MSWNELIETPIKRFWFLLNQIDRLRAERDLRLVDVSLGSRDEKGIQMLRDTLKKEFGEVYVWNDPGPMEVDARLDPEFDREGLRRLKALAQQRIGDSA